MGTIMSNKIDPRTIDAAINFIKDIDDQVSHAFDPSDHEQHQRNITNVMLVLIMSALASGCVAMPDTVRPELTHMSHVTQHSPISHAADYHFGSNTVGVILHWDTPLHAFIELGEAISLDKRFDHDGNAYSYGEIMGPREQFIARIGYTLHIDKTR